MIIYLAVQIMYIIILLAFIVLLLIKRQIKHQSPVPHECIAAMPITGVGLLQTLTAEIKYLSETENLEVDFQASGNPRTLDFNCELHLYSIIREVLENVTRHSHARSAVIRLNYTQSHLECFIKDNGHGFDEHQINHSKSSGIANMKRFSNLINASLEISSDTGGTHVKIHLPLNHN